MDHECIAVAEIDERAPRGTKRGTQALKGSKDRARIPLSLCEHIVEICEDPDKGRVGNLTIESFAGVRA